MQGFRLRVWGFRASKAWCTLLSGFSAQGRTQFLGLGFVEGGCRRGGSSTAKHFACAGFNQPRHLACLTNFHCVDRSTGRATPEQTGIGFYIGVI